MSVWPMLLSQALITYEMNDSQRHERLDLLFEPRPGTILEIKPRAISNGRQDPLKLQGEIWIKPPPGQCLHIRPNKDQADLKICKPTPYPWQLSHIDASGRINILVVAGNTDEGTVLRWPTPYRIANYIPLGAKDTNQHVKAPIRSCRTQIQKDSSDGHQPGDRSITLTLMDGRHWTIDLPTYDTLYSKQKNFKKQKKEPSSNDNHKTFTAFFDSLGKSGEVDANDRLRLRFTIKGQDTYEMASSFFRETASTPGMQGLCRYKFKGALDDPKSGVIECIDAESMDAVYAHVSCFSELSPQTQTDVEPDESSKPQGSPKH